MRPGARGSRIARWTRLPRPFPPRLAPTRTAWDDSRLPRLVKVVALLMQADAADGVLLLTEDASNRISAFTALKEVVGRIDEKASQLSAQYDLRAALLDLQALQ